MAGIYIGVLRNISHIQDREKAVHTLTLYRDGFVSEKEASRHLHDAGYFPADFYLDTAITLDDTVFRKFLKLI